MKKSISPSRFIAIGLFSSAAAIATPAAAEVMVGGAPMLPTQNIVENASKSADHTTLVAAVKAAGLVETLQSKGPFTVFAPTNAAFGALPTGTVETLLKPENKPALTNVLTYHVVPGRISAADLSQQIVQAGGLTTGRLPKECRPPSRSDPYISEL